MFISAKIKQQVEEIIRANPSNYGTLVATRDNIAQIPAGSIVMFPEHMLTVVGDVTILLPPVRYVVCQRIYMTTDNYDQYICLSNGYFDMINDMSEFEDNLKRFDSDNTDYEWELYCIVLTNIDIDFTRPSEGQVVDQSISHTTETLQRPQHKVLEFIG